MCSEKVKVEISQFVSRPSRPHGLLACRISALYGFQVKYWREISSLSEVHLLIIAVICLTYVLFLIQEFNTGFETRTHDIILTLYCSLDSSEYCPPWI